MIPGGIKGRLTRRKVYSQLAPAIMDASSKVGSSWERLTAERNTYGVLRIVYEIRDDGVGSTQGKNGPAAKGGDNRHRNHRTWQNEGRHNGHDPR